MRYALCAGPRRERKLKRRASRLKVFSELLGQRARNSWCGQNRIGFIFVPPEHRGLGHARRIVRALIASILEEDAIPCLFTERGNPVSNRLYTGLSFVRSEYLVHLTPSARS